MFRKLSCVLIFSLIGVTALAKQSLNPAEALRNEVGFVLDKEKFQWKGLTNVPKGYTKFQNPFFSAVYPKEHYFLLPNGGGEDVSDSTGVVFKRFPSNKSSEKGLAKRNWLAVILSNEYSERESIADTIVFRGAVYKSVGVVNSYPAALMLLSAVDRLGGSGKVVASVSVYVYCKGTHYVFDTSFEPGQTSIDIIRSRKFEIPKDFKDIISSFECTGKKVI
ncbi:hypothetical protein ACES2I_14835 [Bdellovibrio bacteriovorus]|uniref:hypothetical protein n=1 Tax=Bdellovibrio bacteriovorus TaxID=959 RepID=UPI0035A73503